MKQKLLGLIEIGRMKENDLLLELVDDSAARRPGEWTIKDTVAHLASWRRVAAGELDAARTGAEAPSVDDDDDVTNAKFYAETHSFPARSILELAAKSWDELAAAVRACSEQSLLGPRPNHPHLKVWQVVPETAVDHIADHLGYLYSDQGDSAAEERAATWRYDVELEAFPEDRRRGVEEYVLGRFYATKGRRDEALAHLERGLALRPELREFAKEDPELAKLLG
jgi:tetratricopeptide (TPR) repeat protein